MATDSAVLMKPKCSKNSWVSLQIGCREHYSIPIMFSHAGLLQKLLTDIWWPPTRLNAMFPSRLTRSLQGRYQQEIAGSDVSHDFFKFMLAEVMYRSRRLSGWQINMDRNSAFQAWAIKQIELLGEDKGSLNVFSYSYSARDVFRSLPSESCKVLAQIDPAFVEEEIVCREHERYSNYLSSWHTAPAEYWENVREEWELADHIVVNSQWSKDALQKQGVAEKKLKIIPLISSVPVSVKKAGDRVLPETFSARDPMRVLFLGAAILRKGIARLLEAAQLLEGSPIVFNIVGYKGISPPEEIEQLTSIRWISPVSRLDVGDQYRNNDVFLFPTLSDGFGMTQLEALQHGLPVISSRYCGEVVRHGTNGEILEDISPEVIAETLLRLVNEPSTLQMYSDNAEQDLMLYSENSIFQKFKDMVDGVSI